MFLRRVANVVYTGVLAGRPVILRFTDPSRRSFDQIESELDWISYLSREGMTVASPVNSLAGALVEKTGDFLVAVFEKAPGGQPQGEFSPALIERWGRYLGRMQALTRRYRPAIQRQEWDRDDLLIQALRGHHPADDLPYRRFNEILA